MCPDGFRVRPGDNTDEAPVCVQLSARPTCSPTPRRRSGPFPRGPHCGPKEERQPAVPRRRAGGHPHHGRAFQAPAAPTLKFRALSLGPWTCTRAASEKIRITTQMFRWTCPTCRPHPRASLKALRINVPPAVFVPSSNVNYPDTVVPDGDELGHCDCSQEMYTIPVATTAAPPRRRPRLKLGPANGAYGGDVQPGGAPNLLTTTLASGESTRAAPTQTRRLRPLRARTTLRMYAKVTVTRAPPSIPTRSSSLSLC